MQRPRLLAGLLLCALIPAGPLHAAPADPRPNIVFIMTDQQSYDAMSCRIGTEHLNTPAIDSLAREGFSFTRAYTANPLCMPARASIFSGRYPHETGVTKNARAGMDPAEFPGMGTYFRSAGYETAYFGKWHLDYETTNTAAHGFERMGNLKTVKGYDRQIADSAVGYLAEPREHPFLLVVSLLNPHDICEYARGDALRCGEIGEAPAAELLPPLPANLAPPRNEPDTIAMVRRGYHANPMFPVGDFNATDWRRLRWGYYRLVEMVDGELGRVLAALRERGLDGSTVVVFTSDHGECAGAHGFNQKTVFYDESARIPLIVRGPGVPAGGETDRLVNTGVDLLPTFLEFAGAEIPDRLPGASLRALTEGRTPARWRDHVVIQNHMDQTLPVGGIRPSAQGRMILGDRFKYCIYSAGERRESLVDIAADPGETIDLAADPAYKGEIERHRALLGEFAREHNDAVALEMLADGVPPRPFTEPAAATR